MVLWHFWHFISNVFLFIHLVYQAKIGVEFIVKRFTVINKQPNFFCDSKVVDKNPTRCIHRRFHSHWLTKWWRAPKKVKSFKRRAIAKKVNEVEKKIESRCITEQKFYWWFVTWWINDLFLFATRKMLNVHIDTHHLPHTMHYTPPRSW